MSDHKNNTQEPIFQALDSQSKACATADLLVRQANEIAAKAEHESHQIFALMVQTAAEAIRNELETIREELEEIQYQKTVEA